MDVRNHYCGYLFIIIMSLGIYFLPSGSFAQTNIPNMATMPTVQQEELTIDTAKAGIDSFLELKKEYGNDGMLDLDPSGGVGAPQELQRYAGFQNTVKNYGFTDVTQWLRTVTSIFLAYHFNTEGKLEEYEQSIQQMKQANLPEETQQQMIAMLDRMKPSDNNLSVARELIEDPEYSGKLKKMQDD